LLATLTWVGDVDGNWMTNNLGNTNWSGNALPGDGDVLVFDASGGNLAQVNDSPAGNSYTLQYDAGGYTLTGNSITLDNSGDDIISNGAVSLSTPFSMPATATFNVASGTLTTSGIISGGGGLTKTGPGTIILNALNDYTGNNLISQGIAVSGTTGLGLGAFGAFNSSYDKIVVESGATVDVNGSARGIAGSIDFYYGMTIAGSGTAGQGALINTGPNNGNGNVQTPRIRLTADATIGGTGNFYMIDGGYAANTLDLAGFTLSKVGTNTFFFANTTATSGTIQVLGGGLSQFQSNSNFSNVDLVLANTAGVNFTLNSAGATLRSLSGGGAAGGVVALGANSLTIAQAVDTTYDGQFTGTGTLIKQGTGMLSLGGTSTSYTGVVQVNGGILRTNNGGAGYGPLGAFNSSPGKVLVASGATLDIGGWSSTSDYIYGVTIAGTGSAGQGALVNTGANGSQFLQQLPNISLSANATIGGTGHMRMIAGGYGPTNLNLAGFTLTKAGTNSFILTNTTVTAGTINIASGSLSQFNIGSDLSAVSVVLANTAGATFDLNSINATVGSLSGGGSTGGNVTLGSGTLTINNAAATTYNGSISGTGGLTKSGAGTLTLGGLSSFTGNVAINAGILLVNNGSFSGGALGAYNSSPTKVVIASGATLDVGGWTSNSDFIYGVTIAGTGTAGQGALINTGVNGNPNLQQLPNINLSANATIGGTGHLRMISAGYGLTTLDLAGFTLTKSGTNNFYLTNTTATAGTINVDSGLLSQTTTGSNLSAANVVLANVAGAGLDLNNLNMSVGSLAGGGATGGNVALGTGTLTVGNGTSTTYAGSISGAGNLTKQGAGTLTLTGSSSFGGTTTVGAGILNLRNGAALGSSTINVQAGAILELQDGITVANSLNLSTNGAIGTLRSLSGDNTWSGSISTSASARSDIAVLADSLTVSGSLIANQFSTKQGAGTLILSGVNGGNGWMDVSGGVVSLRSNTAAVGTYFHVNNPNSVLELYGGVSIPAGEIVYLSGNAVTDNPSFRSVNGANTWGSSVVLHGGTGNRNIGADASSSLTITGVVSRSSGAATFVKVGDGTVTLAGTNTYDGQTNIKAGTLQLQNGNAIANNAGVVTVGLGATLELLSSETVSNLVGVGDAVGSNDGLVALGSNTLTTITSATIADVTSSAGGGIVAGTAIIDGDDDNNITGPSTYLQASTGIGSADPIETAVGAIQVNNTASGDVRIANSNGGAALTISDLRTLGFGGQNLGGAVTISNASPLVVGANVVAAGAVLLAAGDSAATGDDLTVNAGVLVESTGSSVTLNAGDDALVTGNVTAATTVTVNVDEGNADAGVGGAVTITGVITTPAVGGGALLTGDVDDDVFNFAPQATTAFDVNGDLPFGTPTGDTLNLDITGATAASLTLGGIGAGQWSFTPATLRSVVYTSIEDVNANGPYHLVLDANATSFGNTGIDDSLTLRRSGTDFVLERTGDATAPDDDDVGIVFTGDFATILSFTYLGSDDNDILTISDVGGLVDFAGTVPSVTDNGNLAGTAEFLFDGGAGSDRLVFDLTGASAAQSYAIGNGSAAGLEGEVSSTSGGTTLVSYFQDVELAQRKGVGATPGALTIIGDANANTFTTAANDPFTRTSATGYTPFEFSGNNYSAIAINALGGADSLDLESLGTGQTNNPAITLDGGDGNDTIRAQSTSGNTGDLDLIGGSGNDVFELFSSTNTVDGLAGPVDVDGTDGNAGGNVDQLVIIDSGDGSGDDVLIAAVDAATSEDYVITGLGPATSSVTFRSIDDLQYTGTAGDDTIDAQFVATTPLHDLNTVILAGFNGADQFLLFTSDQLGGTSPTPVPSVASGLSSITLLGGDGFDTFGETPTGLTDTGAMDVGLVVPDSTRMIRPSLSTAIVIDGGPPSVAMPTGDSIGDVLNLDISDLPDTLPVVVASGTVNIPGAPLAFAPLTWTDIEDLNLVDDGVLTNVQVGDLFGRMTDANDLVQFSRLNGVNQVRMRVNNWSGVYTVPGKTIVYGRGGIDHITQANLFNPAVFYGEDGNDVLTGASNNDWLVGGAGNDRISGAEGHNVLWGDDAPTSAVPEPQDIDGPNDGDDNLSAGLGNDVFYGGGGNDLVNAGGGNDYVHGGWGNDNLAGVAGDDRLYGGQGDDVLSGYLGNDLLSGGAGNDRLYGQTGNDVLIGGDGEDMLVGDTGNDLLITGMVANEHSTWSSTATSGTYNAATYSDPGDHDAALLNLLLQWGSASNRTLLGSITHDDDDDDVSGYTGADDFCWEAADLLDQPGATTPSDFNAPSMGPDERFGPTI
jgi:autotransporter-associated beta strand protein